MSLATDYFARVRPLLGEGLSRCTIEVDDAEVAQLALELLTSCMLEHIVVTRPATATSLRQELAWKRPFAPVRIDAPSTAPIGARSALHSDARIRARRGRATVTWGAARREVELVADPGDPLAYADASYHVARGLRDALLERVPFPDGPQPSQPSTPPARSSTRSSLAGKHVLLIGCGSLGSEALRLLAGSGARWTLVDPALVTVFNLARQWFGAADVGRAKVDALADRVPRATALRLDTGEPAAMAALDELLRIDPPDVALLATGTHHHGPLAELLSRHAIPHAAACCYPQARFFEVIAVSPRDHTPTLADYRAHLYRGAPAPLPMTDEVAAFLYQPISDAERDRRFTDLVAEPASRIETLRAASLLARCALELASPIRTPWFTRVLAEGTTCLLGGNTAIPLADDEYAYGITTPGQILRLGLDDVTT